MKIVNMHEAKTRLSQLLSAVERGEEIAIMRQGVPVARPVLIPQAASPIEGAWQSVPGWETYVFDPAMLAPMQTEEDLAAEGWPV